MQMKLELVPVPVTDIDRSKAFYTEKLGFVAEVDVRPAPSVRIVQLTPPGSACSLLLSTGLTHLQTPPGSIRGLHLVVDNLEAARGELVEQGVEIGEIDDVGGGVRYAHFADPDGNTLTLQQMAWRTGDSY